MRLRAEYNANDEYHEIIDIYEPLTIRRGMNKCAIEKKSYVCSIHIDSFDNDTVTGILDRDGRAEFDFSDLDIEDIDGVMA